MTTSGPMPTPSPLRPAVAPSVQLGVTVLYTCLYGCLFLVVYIQLWLLLLYRHKRWSYQSVFLFLCLFWAALRTTLFSFYFHNAVAANHLSKTAYWLLYCCPVCLQFFTLSLINLYFTQVLLKVKEKFSSEPSRGLRAARWAYGAMSLLFLCVNVACASLGERNGGTAGGGAWKLVLLRVLVNDLLFILEAVAMAVLLLQLTRMAPSTNPYLHSKGITVCRTAVLGAGVILLFSSRACYNLAVLVLSRDHRVEAFDYNWYNISDQADLRNDLGDAGYLVFGVILVVWELLPTSLLILIFRVRQVPQETGHVTTPVNRGSRSYFFDDPRGIEGDADTPWLHSAHPHNSWFGRSETAPLLFAKNLNQTNQHHTLYSTPQS
ncbi:integral membrane protein GPR137 [Brienomyrus brachyistius]|uniref:integral membrane protein GPR137 n=1 Tax=Brienomyrus brachyistius TaxID=42636 RepID=UPI0020B2F94C|nr:integral membrane protein GPR137 [Brienomyrus brachyistius]XP_048885816.1 integral membrane protein GPR137 [Brienomyrus brachyistius]XP_048885817.1 integral membrane protein GPR137 [Brienomyrus brachyistius]XP_048885818.1 integral membrane protein GPR137 [Brienomyrus brachyistius]XP_048885819.1 integral membrane protein GPR137 [Brienomyrus brachyistius]